MMGPKCEREGIGQNVLRHHSDRRHTFCVTYHLLGVLCWLYPVGYPRIYALNILQQMCVSIRFSGGNRIILLVTNILIP